MRRSIQRVRGALFGLAVAGALGFGAREALATPQPPPQGPLCNSAQCDQICRLIGANGGFCSRGGCFCFR
ncbi:MAG TPA: hypothetical protein VHG91_16835 [Longimicrobium sp.]|nr:hypothetical protein [Longimicrobium sp.]